MQQKFRINFENMSLSVSRGVYCTASIHHHWIIPFNRQSECLTSFLQVSKNYWDIKILDNPMNCERVIESHVFNHAIDWKSLNILGSHPWFIFRKSFFWCRNARKGCRWMGSFSTVFYRVFWVSYEQFLWEYSRFYGLNAAYCMHHCVLNASPK